MKSIAVAAMMFVGSAFADVPTFTASKVKCQTLKENLESYGSIVVIKKILMVNKKIVIHKDANCDSDQYAEEATFKTKDTRNCNVGQVCKNDHSSSYSSGDSYSSGYSGSYSGGYSGSYSGGYSGSYSSGSSSSGSSSSSSHGSSYNPPSSSSHGSSYNPPSSGTRGSRYCPGC